MIGGGAVHLLGKLSKGVKTVVATHQLYLDSAPSCLREVYVVVGEGEGGRCEGVVWGGNFSRVQSEARKGTILTSESSLQPRPSKTNKDDSKVSTRLV